jgi:hypothetical protein
VVDEDAVALVLDAVVVVADVVVLVVVEWLEDAGCGVIGASVQAK